MYIAHLNTSYPSGGSGRIAYDLFDAMKRAGHESEMVVASSSTPDQFTVVGHQSSFPMVNQLFGPGLIRGLQKITGPLRLRSMDSVRAWENRMKAELSNPTQFLNNLLGRDNFDHRAIRHWWQSLLKKPDIVHLHDLHGGFYFDLRDLPELSGDSKVVLTLHNEWPYTGLCHYTLGCDRWASGCGQCPHWKMYPVYRDNTRPNLERKRRIYKESALYVSGPSRWIVGKAKKSILKEAAVEMKVIPNGVDLSVFKPGPMDEARAASGIPGDRIVFLFLANKTKSAKWKGFNYVDEAYTQLTRRIGVESSCLVIVGEALEKEPGDTRDIRYVPFVSKKEELTRYYQAADVFVHTAIADNFPTTLLEAMACGLPVVSFDTGGIPEQITNGENGLISATGDVDAISANMEVMIGEPDLRARMKTAALERRGFYSLDRMHEDYLKWYQEISGKE
ncbi:MAG: glycosyltransferase [Verrucomicrobiota bacterium]